MWQINKIPKYLPKLKAKTSRKLHPNNYLKRNLPPHHKHPTLNPQEYHSTLETWRVLSPNQRRSELTFYKGLHHLVSIQILHRSSGFRYELLVVTAMTLRWLKASPRTIKLLLWLPSKVVLGIRRSFVVIHKKKRKTWIVRSFLYLQMIFNSSVLQFFR